MTTTFHRQTAGNWTAACLLIGLVMSGCGYKTLSPRANEFASTLYSICNQKDASRLEQFSRLLETEVEQGRISDDEATWLRDIVFEARSGDWAAASAASRQLLEDQVHGH